MVAETEVSQIHTAGKGLGRIHPEVFLVGFNHEVHLSLICLEKWNIYKEEEQSAGES
jgi:hypothetical protein